MRGLIIVAVVVFLCVVLARSAIRMFQRGEAEAKRYPQLKKYERWRSVVVVVGVLLMQPNGFYALWLMSRPTGEKHGVPAMVTGSTVTGLSVTILGFVCVELLREKERKRLGL